MNARLLFATAIATGTLTLGSWSSAQDIAPAAAAERTDAVAFDVVFEGGTLADFVAQLRQLDDGANIIVTNDAANLPVSAIRLVDVTAADCVWMLAAMQIRDGDSLYDIWSDSNGTLQSATVTVIGQEVIRSRAQSRTSQRQVPSRDYVATRVFSIGDLLEAGFTAEETLAAIKQLRSLSGDDAKWGKAVIDQSVGVLMMRGGISQIDTVEELLDAMSASQSYRRSQVTAAQAAASGVRKTAANIDWSMVKVRLLRANQLSAMSTQSLATRVTQLDRVVEALEADSPRLGKILNQLELTKAALTAKAEAGEGPGTAPKALSAAELDDLTTVALRDRVVALAKSRKHVPANSTQGAYNKRQFQQAITALKRKSFDTEHAGSN